MIKKYNTAIIQVTGISDLNIIIEILKSFKKESLEKTKEEFVKGNMFGFNITSSRKRIFSIIKKYISEWYFMPQINFDNHLIKEEWHRYWFNID